MNFEDFDVGSLQNQKVPYPIIESIVLNDQDGISLDIRWSIYAPVVGDKDIFDSYKSILSTQVVLFTRDISKETIHWLNEKKLTQQGPFLKTSMTPPKIQNYYGGELGVSKLYSSDFPFDGFTVFESTEGNIRKYSFEDSFGYLKATDKNGKKIADDRIIDLMGFIQVTADFGKGNLPFPVKASALSYALPFVIAKGGTVDFTYQALQTNENEIWAGPFSVSPATALDPVETITKIPVDDRDPNLSFVTITDPTVVTNFVGMKTGDFFQLDFNSGVFGKKLASKEEAVKFASVNLKDYFSSNKLEKIESPIGEMYYWGDVAPNSINLAFQFNIGKFMNSSAFKFTNTGINTYSGNIKALTILRRKIAKNIEEKYKEDFLEKELLSVNGQQLGYVFTDGAMGGFKTHPNKKTAIYTYDIYDASNGTGDLGLLFSIKDNTVDNNYKYQYRLKVTYDSKFLSEIQTPYEDAQAAYNEFSALEQIISITKFYNSDFERMTPLFVEQYEGILTKTQKAFNTLFLVLQGIIPQQKINEIKSVIATINKLLDPAIILPSTYLVLKEALQLSLEQVKNFSLASGLNIKPKQADSKGGSTAHKYYEFPNWVEATSTDRLMFDYFSDEQPESSANSMIITNAQIENLSKLEYAKYYGSLDGVDDIKLVRQSFTPLTFNFNKITVKTLDNINLYSIIETNLTNLILSTTAGSPQNYTQGAGTKNNSPLLRSLLDNNISVMDSTVSENFTNPTDFSKFSFIDFFGNGDPFNKDDLPFSVGKKEVYQDLEALSTEYDFMMLLGKKTYEDAIKHFEKLTTESIQHAESLEIDEAGNIIGNTTTTSLPISYFALNKGLPAETASPSILKIRSALSDTTKNLTLPQKIFLILTLTNVVYIQVLVDNKWQEYTEEVKKQIRSTYVLARLAFLQQDHVVNYLSSKQSIINEYFIIDTESKSSVASFEIPNNKNPKKTIPLLVPITANQKTGGLLDSVIGGSSKPLATTVPLQSGALWGSLPDKVLPKTKTPDKQVAKRPDKPAKTTTNIAALTTLRDAPLGSLVSDNSTPTRDKGLSRQATTTTKISRKKSIRTKTPKRADFSRLLRKFTAKKPSRKS